jgi:hypothetical protein
MYISINVPVEEVEMIENDYASCPECLANLHHIDMEQFDGKRLVCQNCPEDFVSDGETGRFRALHGPQMDCSVCLNEVRDYCYFERNGTLEVDAEQSHQFKCSECTEGPVPGEDVDLSEISDI